MCHCWNLFCHQESVIPCFLPLPEYVLLSSNFRLLREPLALPRQLLPSSQLCRDCMSSCFLCFPRGQQKAFNLSCHFRPLESPASCSSTAGPGRRAGEGWGPGVLTVLPAALRSSYFGTRPAEHDGCACDGCGAYPVRGHSTPLQGCSDKCSDTSLYCTNCLTLEAVRQKFISQVCLKI